MKTPKKNKILVVDDEREICNILEKVLSQAGLQVITAFSGAEALRALKKTPVDLAVIDLKMAGLDGLETLKRLRELQKNLKAIILTAYGTATTARDAMGLGVYEFLTKPFDNKVLIKAVKGALSD